MLTLFHHPLLAASRFVRLAFGEYGEELAPVEEKPWTRREEFLALNPAGTLPVLFDEGDVPIVGAVVIAEYLDETRGVAQGERRCCRRPDRAGRDPPAARLVPAEVREEVTRHLVREDLKRDAERRQGGGSPDAAAIRAARANIRYHLSYIG